MIRSSTDACALLIYGVVALGVTPAHQAGTVVNRDERRHDFLLFLQLEARLHKVWSNGNGNGSIGPRIFRLRVMRAFFA